MLALVTDSTCGLTRNEAAELGVDVLPMGYAAAGVRHAEGFVGENGDYAPALRSGGLVTTEAVRPSAFERVFRRNLESGNEVLCITISSRLSGTFRSAEQAAEAVGGERVTVFDSWGTAGALEFLVRRARALANAGSSVAQIVEELSALSRNNALLKAIQALVKVVAPVPNPDPSTPSGGSSSSTASPTTGDTFPVAAVAGLLAVSAGAAVVLGKKRKENE